MSITDELRDWFKDRAFMGSGWQELDHIADRIDAEHEAACAEAYGDGVMSVPIALDESQWVKLPMDADGVPIRAGDVMDSKVDYLFDGKPFTVRALVLCEDGWEVSDGRFGNRYEPDSLHHHHEPTVEDVLRECCHKYHSLLIDDMNDAISGVERDYIAPAEIIAEYAAKLQLREVDG